MKVYVLANPDAFVKEAQLQVEKDRTHLSVVTAYGFRQSTFKEVSAAKRTFREQYLTGAKWKLKK